MQGNEAIFEGRGGYLGGRFSDRRVGADRRSQPTPMLSWSTFARARRAVDRRGDVLGGAYVDRYSKPLGLVIITIAILCVLDAHFTLAYLQRGGEEANPVMERLIHTGPRTFILVKCGATNLAMLFLCLRKNFRYMREAIGTILALYTLLLLYHLVLVMLMP